MEKQEKIEVKKPEIEEKKEIKKTKEKKVEKEISKKTEIKKEKPKKEPEKEEYEEKKTGMWSILFTIIVIFLIVVVIFYVKDMFQEKEVVEGAAATVNNEAISLQELNENYEALPEQYKMFITKEQVLDQLIEQKLLLQEAVKKGISATEQDIDDAINEILRQNLLTMEQFEEMAAERGLAMEDIRDSYKNQIMVNKLLEQEVKSKVDISEDKIKEYYDSMIRASHILVATKEEAEEILKKLGEGTDFAELAQEKSLDKASAARDGDLGEFAKGQMVAEFEEVAFDLEVNEVSDVVQTSYGYHIIKRSPKNLTYEETKDSIRDILTAPEQQELYAEYIETLMDKANIVIHLGAELPEVEEEIPEIIVGEELEEEVEEIEEVEELEEVEEIEEGEEIEEVEEEIVPETCFGKYGLTADTVIFYFADWCLSQEQCSGPKAVVENLEEQGYKFHMAEVGAPLIGCFDLENENIVPQFICAGTGNVRIGSLSEASLKSFAEKCE